MENPAVNRRCLALISVLLVFGTPGIGYGQAPTLAASPSPLWESSLNGAVVTLTLTGGSYERADIRDFVTVAGIAGVTVDSFYGIKRASSTEVTVELQFSGHLAADGTLTFTVQAQAIASYDGAALTAELPVPAGLGPFGRDPGRDFNTLSAAGNDSPYGLWSDGITMWVSDYSDDKLYAYDMATRAHDPGRDFNTLSAAGNNHSDFLWSDGITMWVVDRTDEKIYAYDMATRARDPGRDFNTLSAAGNNHLQGLWSDGITMWVADFADKLYAYDMATKARDPDEDFNILKAARKNIPKGIWSDGITMWVVSYDLYGKIDNKIDNKILAYDMATKAADPGKDFNTLYAAGNNWPTDIWSDGITMWVADFGDSKLYAYKMPSGSLAGAGEPEDSAAPDLVVQSPAVSNSSPDAGTAFTFSATVRNQGTTQSPPTTLRFYRSTDGTVSTSDTEVGSNAVGALAAAATGAESISLTAPSSAGTYYYGACVESVGGESDTQNNCSSAVAVSVAAAPETPAAAGADFNGDGTVDFADFFEFVDAFGGSDPRFDLNGDGSVDFADFFEFVDAFGQPAQAKLVAMAQDMIGLPAGPQLQQNAPNPFNSETVISWFLLQPGPARLEVFALTGQRLAVLHRGPLPAGRHRIHWDGRDSEGRALASGVYLYRLVSAESVLTRKLTLLR